MDKLSLMVGKDEDSLEEVSKVSNCIAGLESVLQDLEFYVHVYSTWREI